jgi:DNA-binding PadR family transcriptional regulator
MSNDEATNKPPIDEAIIDFLSKKGGITDQTEKLALGRITSKTGVSLQQVEISINRLSSKNLIRKIYQQGKVGFELTPKGKSALEALAKAETDRITKQLQDAIQQEQKAKQRMNAVKRIKSIEDEWQNYQTPDNKLMDNIEQEAMKLLSATKETKEKQPLCELNPQNYEEEFLQYKAQIEKLIGQNSSLTQIVDNYAKIKNDLQHISADTANAYRAINKYASLAEAIAQVNQLKTSLSKLKLIQAQLETFDMEQVTRFIEFRTLLRDNSRLLEILRKPTHEFEPIKIAASPEKTVQYFDTEGPINDGYKTSGYPLMEKCSKCGVKRKSARVDIG